MHMREGALACILKEGNHRRKRGGDPFSFRFLVVFKAWREAMSWENKKSKTFGR